MLTYTFEVDGVPTDADSVKFSDPLATYGMRRSDDATVVIADGVDWVHSGVGEYEYDESALDLEPNTLYDYWVEAVYDGTTIRRQVFITGEGDAVDGRTIRFVMIENGAPVNLVTMPKLSNPTNTYGAVRLDTGAVVVANETPFVENGTLYSVSWGEPAADLDYRYYIEVLHNAVTRTLARTTKSGVNSACLVIGRYTDSIALESMYTADSIHQWMTTNVDSHEDPVDYALRMAQFISDVEAYIDERLAGPFAAQTFTMDTVPAVIKRVATALVGVAMYDARGVIDYNTTTGQPEHRYAFQRRRAERQLSLVKSGYIVVDGATLPSQAPEMVLDDPLPDQDTEPVGYAWPGT